LISRNHGAHKLRKLREVIIREDCESAQNQFINEKARRNNAACRSFVDGVYD